MKRYPTYPYPTFGETVFKVLGEIVVGVIGLAAFAGFFYWLGHIFGH